MNKGYAVFHKNHWYVVPTESTRLTKEIVKAIVLATCSDELHRSMTAASLEKPEMIKLCRTLIEPCRFEERMFVTKFEDDALEKRIHLETGKGLNKGKGFNHVGNYKPEEITIIEEV